MQPASKWDRQTDRQTLITALIYASPLQQGGVEHQKNVRYALNLLHKKFPTVYVLITDHQRISRNYCRRNFSLWKIPDTRGQIGCQTNLQNVYMSSREIPRKQFPRNILYCTVLYWYYGRRLLPLCPHLSVDFQIHYITKFIGPILLGHRGPLCHTLSLSSTSMRRLRATVAACSSDTWWMGVRRLAVANGPIFKCFLFYTFIRLRPTSRGCRACRRGRNEDATWETAPVEFELYRPNSATGNAGTVATQAYFRAMPYHPHHGSFLWSSF